MAQCWAKCLGNCSGKISGEHIITAGLFKGASIGVSGLPWCRAGYKFIPKSAYTANILCRKHNSDLSPVDDAAIHAINIFRTLAKVHEQRKMLLQSRLWSGRFDVYDYTICGSRLERWFLKTLINTELVGGQKLPIGELDQRSPNPPLKLVEVAFGSRRFAQRAGLYFAAVEGEVLKTAERVHYVSLVKTSAQGDFVAAGEFRFYGFRFFLCLEAAGLPHSIHTDNGALKLLHHVPVVNLELAGKPSQRIIFTWLNGGGSPCESTIRSSAAPDSAEAQ